MRLAAPSAFVALILTAGQAAAQQRGIPAGGPVANAVRAEQAPDIDGRERDAVWAGAPETTEFQEFQPAEGKTPRYKTSFKVAYDDRNLYVFVRAYDDHPDSIMTALTRRDVRGPSDQLKVMIDSYNDRRSGFEFAVNPIGVKRDYAMYNDNSEDDAWDGIWDVATQIDSVGWTAEFRIPFSQLRYTNADEHVFGFAIWRDIERYKERTSWPLYKPSASGISSQLGYLQGVRNITPFHRLEMTPFTLAKSTPINRGSVPVGQSPWARTQKVSAGMDLKYGVTPNLTLDATVNPDFGQVEADPSVVNLSAFETFFQERRPFFIEGSGTYSFGIGCSIVNCSGENLFYSRRIGRSPQLFGRYANVESPNVTPILGAAKLTGRVGGNINVGVLEAMTGKVQGTLDRTTEPRTNYTVARAVQDLRNGATSIGLIGTAVNRSLDSWTEAFLRSNAYTVGGNFSHRMTRSRYEITGNLTQSYVSGSRQSIYATQLSTVHNYQRPDAGLRLDSMRTSLSGTQGQLTFGKFAGNMFHFQSAYEFRTAGYEINDLGFLQRANQQTLNNWQQLGWRKPTSWYRNMTANVNEWAFWTMDGLPTEKAVNTNWHINFTNNMWLHFGGTASRLGTVYCDACSRGGPAVRRSASYSPWFGVQGDDRRRIVPGIFFNFNRADEGRGGYTDINPSLTLIPTSQLQVSLNADFFSGRENTQWFNNYTTNGTTHYVFARLKQEQISVGARVSYTATPTLSLQLYAAPFVSRGQYSDFRELSSTPRASSYDARYLAYTPPSSASLGFDVLQLRSTSLVRWEFRPGSTLFAVWTHGRDGFDARYRERGYSDEYRDLFGLHPDNTFLIKMAYWINR